VVINCAGLYGDKIESMLADAAGGRGTPAADGKSEEPPFKVTPRKGQFLVYQLSDADRRRGDQLSSDVIIEPVATEFTKGVIVWKTLYGNIIVGPTATNVSSPEDYNSDIETQTALQLFGEKVLPCLKRAQVVGSYTGLRPATEHRDYQIYPAKGTNGARWITVGGIRSTGNICKFWIEGSMLCAFSYQYVFMR
jgi:glycerol-3-phosphate dehydrogenase